MSSAGQLTPDHLYYSLLYGGGVYRWKGEVVTDPLATLDDDMGSSPVLTSVFSREEFYARRLDACPVSQHRIHKQVLQPPPGDTVLWPHDMISLSTEQRGPFKLFADIQYIERPKDADERLGESALLFVGGESDGAVRASTKLARIDEVTWENDEVKKLAVQIILAFERFNQLGYGYNDINLDRFLVRHDGKVMLDYSTLIYSFDDYRSLDAQQLCAPGQGEYPLEYAEPAYVRGIIDHLDFDSQNYGLCALLFYLFFGRRAYDGKLLVGYSDDTVLQHYAKIRAFHDMPVFIFDAEDDRNALGLFAEDEELIRLWNKCPSQLRDLFSMVLVEDNALRRRQVTNPPPRTWLKVFEQLGWLD